MTAFSVGVLSASTTGGPLDTVASPSASQVWTMNGMGNFTSVTTNGTTQSQTANAQNELTTVGTATLAYNANGNLTTDQTGQQLVYDAWNRLVWRSRTARGVFEASYAYNGLGNASPRPTGRR